MKPADLFTPQQNCIVDQLKEQDLAERRADSTDPLRLKAVSPGVAQFLQMMILHGQARIVAEFGTSAGYSTIHLAEAVRRTGGCVHTLDREPKKTAWARENLMACGLIDFVQFFTGACADFVANLPGDLDLVFFDFGVPSFRPYWPQIRAKTKPGTMIFVDGWEKLERWESEPEWKAFKDTMESDPEYMTCLLPLEKGNLVALRVQ